MFLNYLENALYCVPFPPKLPKAERNTNEAYFCLDVLTNKHISVLLPFGATLKLQTLKSNRLKLWKMRYCDSKFNPQQCFIELIPIEVLRGVAHLYISEI